MVFYNYKNLYDIMLLKFFKITHLQKFCFLYTSNTLYFYRVVNFFFKLTRTLMYKSNLFFLKVSVSKHSLSIYYFKFLKVFYFLVSHPTISSKTRRLIYSIDLKNSLIFEKLKKFSKTSQFKTKTKCLKNNFLRFSKKKHFFFFFKSKKQNFVFWKMSVFWFKQIETQKYFVMLVTSFGSYEINPLTYGSKYVNVFRSLYWYLIINGVKPLGLGGYLGFFEESFFYHNLIYKKKFYSCSNGTFVSVYYFDYILQMYLITLPSEKKLFFPKSAYCYIGRNANVMWRQNVQGGFFSKFFKFFKNPKVRGIAKNPVDHPNGGRTNVKNPLKTPWGLIAKKSK